MRGGRDKLRAGKASRWTRWGLLSSVGSAQQCLITTPPWPHLPSSGKALGTVVETTETLGADRSYKPYSMQNLYLQSPGNSRGIFLNERII